MWVIIKHKSNTEVRYFKHKFIKYYFCIIINKLKKKEVVTIDER